MANWDQIRFTGQILRTEQIHRVLAIGRRGPAGVTFEGRRLPRTLTLGSTITDARVCDFCHRYAPASLGGRERCCVKKSTTTRAQGFGRREVTSFGYELSSSIRHCRIFHAGDRRGSSIRRFGRSSEWTPSSCSESQALRTRSLLVVSRKVAAQSDQAQVHHAQEETAVGVAAVHAGLRSVLSVSRFMDCWTPFDWSTNQQPAKSVGGANWTVENFGRTAFCTTGRSGEIAP